jgi:two-component system sensor histidine kinase CpxA
MRSLFLKIFFLFWLSNAVLFVLAYLAFIWFADDGFVPRPGYRAMESFALQAATIYERDGHETLRAYLTQLHHAERIRGFVLDAQGHALTEPVPASIATQIVQYPQWIRPATNRAGRFFISAIEVRLASGTPYRFIATHRTPLHWWRRARPPLGRFGFFLLATALASAVIAGLITRPLRRLRLTTQQFAEGDLAIRAPVTIRRRTDAIGELGREFDHMAERIETLVESQTRLLRDVSHELRSPLARIQVAATLAEEHVDEVAAHDLERIQIEIERLKRLIERLLTLSRVESDANPLVMRDVDLTALLEQIIADATYEYHGDEKRVHLDAPPHTIISGDESALRSALENVLRNALYYTAKATEVTVTVEAPDHESSMLRLQVHDRGPGIPEAHLTRVFEPFFRSDDARSERTGGHGIGLAISRAIIERHGGQIQAHNHPQGGLCITIKLPR